MDCLKKECNCINKFGVTLRLLTHDKIEMLRNWRNDPDIQKYMEYRSYITSEMQECWFKQISTSGRDFYFIIEYEGKEVGCINLKNVDFQKGEGEPGLFIYDNQCLGTDVPVRASLCLGYFAWDVLKLKSEYIHVLSDNKRAIRYNKLLGFKIAPGQENVYSQLYILTREDAEKSIKRLKNYLLNQQ